MLEAQRTSEEKERKIRSFHEIAVLYRTQRQGELLENLSEKRRNSVRGIRKRILFKRRDCPSEHSLFPVPSGSGTDGGKRRRKPSVCRRRRKSPWQSAVEETAQVWKKKIQGTEPGRTSERMDPGDGNGDEQSHGKTIPDGSML